MSRLKPNTETSFNVAKRLTYDVMWLVQMGSLSGVVLHDWSGYKSERWHTSVKVNHCNTAEPPEAELKMSYYSSVNLNLNSNKLSASE